MLYSAGIQGQGERNGIANIAFLILNLDGKAAACVWKTGSAAGVQKDITGQIPAPILPDFNKTYRLDADPGLLKGAPDPVHVSIRILCLEEDLPGFPLPDFL